MNISEKTINILLAAFIAIICLLVYSSVNAKEFSVYDEKNHHYDEVGKGERGLPGANGINGRNGSTGLDGLSYNNSIFNRSIAITGALSQIPALSHVNEHKHTGFGTGIANYADQNAFAVGLLHQENNRSYKATIGVSGSQTVIGGGASFTW